MEERPKAPRGIPRLVITGRCQHCGAGLVILCERALGPDRSVTEEFPCPKCDAQLRRKLPGPLIEARSSGLV